MSVCVRLYVKLRKGEICLRQCVRKREKVSYTYQCGHLYFSIISQRVCQTSSISVRKAKSPPLRYLCLEIGWRRLTVRNTLAYYSSQKFQSRSQLNREGWINRIIGKLYYLLVIERQVVAVAVAVAQQKATVNFIKLFFFVAAVPGNKLECSFLERLV